MITLRKRHPVFRRRRFFQGRPIKGANVKDVLWLNPGGNEMSEEEWRDPSFTAWECFFPARDWMRPTNAAERSATKIFWCC